MIKKYLLILLLMLLGPVYAQNISKNIIVDQFGYLPDSKKIAVIKNPIKGFDSTQTFTPGNTYALVNANTGEHVFTASPVIWNGGNTDVSSGDKAWHFDFSAVTTKGRYYVLDIYKNLKSFEFEISPIVYKEVLRQALRFFYYQRAGFPKEAQYAGIGWADGASHVGPLQDLNCRLYSSMYYSTTEVDVHGGWYDAGDYNKYTNWTANYVVEMMKAYLENPSAWADNYNIPESGNGIPDILDEAKWGLDFLLRMQRPNGSVLSIVGESHASPPSSAKGQSVYGPATSSASLNSAAAFAISSKIYRLLNMGDYADTLVARAIKAWNWASVNPNVLFKNSSLVGAGEQEEDSYTRSMSKLQAACHLYEVTKDTIYQKYFDNNFQNAHLVAWTFAFPYEARIQDILLYYTSLDNATQSVVASIKNAFNTSMLGYTDNFPAYYSAKDPYLAYLGSYTWGSNAIKSCEGNMFYHYLTYSINSAKNADAREAALCYIHYIHGVNPLNMTYLSNMYRFGGENCVNTFYHTWFAHGSAKWDKVGVSTYGPPPGYLTGGPNPSYNWYSGCPNNCGSPENNAACLAESITPPRGQPNQKSYKDFNTSWPIDSWEVTEPSCGYQVNYIRLLSKFVIANMDCNGDTNGTAYLDTCRICSGGNTGRYPEIAVCNCAKFQRESNLNVSACESFNSPSGKYIWNVSGLYSDTVAAKSGCDSILSLNLLILHSSVASTNITACEQYTSVSGKYKWISSGIYYDTIPNKSGCDSLMTINLNITHSSSASLKAEACDHFLAPSGKITWYNSGTYLDTILNVAGCDSILSVNLSILHSSVASTNITACEKYTSVSGKYNWTSSGIYYDTIPNKSGCDSLMTINLKITHSSSASLLAEACDHFLAPSGKITWYNSGTYLDTIPNVEGCDSIITVNLAIIKPNISISNLGDTLFAKIDSASFQWLDCNLNKALIDGATGFSFQPSQSGDYAVIVMKNSCTDTSACYHLILTGVPNETENKKLRVYPNPGPGIFEISLPSVYRKVDIQVLNTLGQIIIQESFSEVQRIPLILHAASGIYFLKVRNEGQQEQVVKLILE